jgi:hypothetical protein
MLKRPESELQIVESHNPLLTVEVDLDGFPEELNEYGDLVTKALTSIVAKSPKMRATIYVYQGMSINFHRQTWSAFFGVAGNKKLLDVLLHAFRAAKVADVRFSDYIDPSTATTEFHIQDGYVWRPWELGTWYAGSEDEENLAEDVVEETDIEENDDSEHVAEVTDEGDSRISSPARFRAARNDASVGTIRKKIEEIFGLPEGSVALCDPDKKALRGDATIATLRKRWE